MNTSRMGRLAWTLPVVACLAWLALPGAAFAALQSHLVQRGATTPSDVNATFPVTPVGETSSITCAAVCFSVSGQCDGSGTVTLDHNVSAPFSAGNYRIGSSSTCGGTATTLPAHLNAGQALYFDMTFAPTSGGTFSDVLTLSGLNFDLSGSTSAASGSCTPNATTLCIDQNPGDHRFMIRVHYSTTEGGGFSGDGNAIPLASLGVSQGGLFWFFASTNPEMLIKILDGCALNSNFWVFFAATTNVGFTVTVTDTATGHQVSYTNPDLNAAPPLQDTSALPCP